MDSTVSAVVTLGALSLFGVCSVLVLTWRDRRKHHPRHGGRR